MFYLTSVISPDAWGLFAAYRTSCSYSSNSQSAILLNFLTRSLWRCCSSKLIFVLIPSKIACHCSLSSLGQQLFALFIVRKSRSTDGWDDICAASFKRHPGTAKQHIWKERQVKLNWKFRGQLNSNDDLPVPFATASPYTRPKRVASRQSILFFVVSNKFIVADRPIKFAHTLRPFAIWGIPSSGSVKPTIAPSSIIRISHISAISNPIDLQLPLMPHKIGLAVFRL